MTNALADLLGEAVEETEATDVPRAAPQITVETKSIGANAPPTNGMSSFSNLGRAPKPGQKSGGAAAEEEEEEPVDEFADEVAEVEIGSARAAADKADDDFDDEFDLPSFSAAPPPPASNYHKVSASGGGDIDEAARARREAAKREAVRRDQIALQAAVDAAQEQAEQAAAEEAAAAHAAELAAARAVADEAAATAAAATAPTAPAEDETAAASKRIHDEMRAALATVQQSVSEPGAGVGPVPTEKSRAEKADEVYAANRKNIGSISEEAEEEEEEEEAAPTAVSEAVVDAAPAPTREERLMAQFEAATAVADESRATKGRVPRGAGPEEAEAAERLRRIHYGEASGAIMGADFTEQRQTIVVEDWSGSSLRRMFPCLRPKLATADLREQRARFFCAAKVPLGSEPLHERMLFSVYRLLTGDETPPPRHGPHWEAIGFQGSDPATDLRGAGILALLQVLHMGMKRTALMHAIYKLSRTADFPFMTVSINVTQIVMNAVRAGALTSRANKSRQLYDVAHTYHSACYLYLYQARRPPPPPSPPPPPPPPPRWLARSPLYFPPSSAPPHSTAPPRRRSGRIAASRSPTSALSRTS